MNKGSIFLISALDNNLHRCLVFFPPSSSYEHFGDLNMCRDPTVSALGMKSAQFACAYLSETGHPGLETLPRTWWV